MKGITSHRPRFGGVPLTQIRTGPAGCYHHRKPRADAVTCWPTVLQPISSAGASWILPSKLADQGEISFTLAGTPCAAECSQAGQVGSTTMYGEGFRCVNSMFGLSRAPLRCLAEQTGCMYARKSTRPEAPRHLGSSPHHWASCERQPGRHRPERGGQDPLPEVADLFGPGLVAVFRQQGQA